MDKVMNGILFSYILSLYIFADRDVYRLIPNRIAAVFVLAVLFRMIAKREKLKLPAFLVLFIIFILTCRISYFAALERVVSNLSLNLPDICRRFVVVYDGDSVGYPHGGKLLCLDTKPASSFLGKISVFVKRVQKVRRIKREYGIETSISFLGGPNMVNIFSKRKKRIVISVRNCISKSERGFYGFIYKLLIQLYYNRADCMLRCCRP